MQTLEDIRTFGLLPVNLVAMGIKRAVGTDEAGPPDILTVWKTPYPVLTNYEKLCIAARIDPYGGGDRNRQGHKSTEGYITSGFRESLGAENTPHKWGMAIDVVIIGLPRQIEVARIAVKYFMRVGLYPDENIMHFDLAPVIWQIYYNATPYWVKLKGKYHPFFDLDRAIEFAKNNST